ncbi:MAG: CapA family protein [Deltaproteobacteria bacterium]|jgi:poly-gamma-glutamate synthesis protein (capsule biosynthesis protein)|nr:CapA family protein [Deltaproteobacteria bacterium]
MSKTRDLLALFSSIIFFLMTGAPLAAQTGYRVPMEDPSRLVVDDEVVVFEIPPLKAPAGVSGSAGKDSSGSSAEKNVPPGASGKRPPAVRTTSVVFIGDIMCHGEQLKFARTEDGFDFRGQFRLIKPYLAGAMVVGNVETTFAGESFRYSGYPSFNSPDELAEAVSDLGVHVATLANNHIFDKGNAGARRTIEVLESRGIIWTGLGTEDILTNQPLLVEYDGLKWAFLNFSYGSNTSLPRADRPENLRLNVINEDSILEGLEMARALNPDVTILLLHWGNEYQQTPTRSQRNMARLAADNGADLVVGTHPHVLQPVSVLETERGRSLVAYSLGNFVSNQRARPRERSVILKADFEIDSFGAVSLKRVSAAPIYTSRQCVKKVCSIRVLYAGEPVPARPTGAESLTAKGSGKAASGESENRARQAKGGEAGTVPDDAGFVFGSGEGSSSSGRTAAASGGAALPAAPVAGSTPAAPEPNAPSPAPDASGVVEYALILAPESRPPSPPPSAPEAARPPAAGEPDRFENFVGASLVSEDPDAVSEDQAELAVQAGESVLSFLGVEEGARPDDKGFYLLWDRDDPRFPVESRS